MGGAAAPRRESRSQHLNFNTDTSTGAVTAAVTQSGASTRTARPPRIRTTLPTATSSGLHRRARTAPHSTPRRRQPLTRGQDSAQGAPGGGAVARELSGASSALRPSSSSAAPTRPRTRIKRPSRRRSCSGQRREEGAAGCRSMCLPRTRTRRHVGGAVTRALGGGGGERVSARGERLRRSRPVPTRRGQAGARRNRLRTHGAQAAAQLAASKRTERRSPHSCGGAARRRRRRVARASVEN